MAYLHGNSSRVDTLEKEVADLLKKVTALEKQLEFITQQLNQGDNR